MEISKEVWRDVLDVLKKHKISYTTNLEGRDVPKSMGDPNDVVWDKHIQINLTILNYYENSK